MKNFEQGASWPCWQLCSTAFIVRYDLKTVSGFDNDAILLSYKKKLRSYYLKCVEVAVTPDKLSAMVLLKFEQVVQFTLFWAKLWDRFTSDARAVVTGTVAPAYDLQSSIRQYGSFWEPTIQEKAKYKPTTATTPASNAISSFSDFLAAFKPTDGNFQQPVLLSRKSSSVAEIQPVAPRPLPTINLNNLNPNVSVFGKQKKSVKSIDSQVIDYKITANVEDKEAIDRFEDVIP